MGKTKIHAIDFSLLALIVFSGAEGINPEGRKTPRIDRVHQKLKLLNKPPIKTIHLCLSVAIVRDLKPGNWWVAIGNDTTLGYWPGKLFECLSHSAILVEWGEVYSFDLKSPHTATEWGVEIMPRLSTEISPQKCMF